MGNTPFDNLDSAHEYLRLLAIQVSEVSEEIRQEIAAGESAGAERRVDALRLVAYKLQQLNENVTASRSILNDLRMLRRVLIGETQPPPVTRTRASSVRRAPPMAS